MDKTEIVTVILSIVGACAWLPEIWRSIVFNCTRIQASVIDVVHIKGFTMHNSGGNNSIVKKGELLIIAIDFFTYYKSVFIRNYEIEIKLSAGEDKIYKAVVGNTVYFNNFDDKGNKIPKEYDLPIETNININPLFVSGQNNIRIIPCLLEDVPKEREIKMCDIKEINFIYQMNSFKRRKVIHIKCDESRFSVPKYIRKYAKDRSI